MKTISIILIGLLVLTIILVGCSKSDEVTGASVLDTDDSENVVEEVNEEPVVEEEDEEPVVEEVIRLRGREGQTFDNSEN